MCGIVGAIAERNVVPILMEGLRRLEYRGYDSAGIAVLNGTAHLKRLRTVGKVKMLQDAIDADPTHGQVGIAHTRWATHGVPSERNAHPHVSHDGLAIVHNGIIENHEELREDLKKLGYKFTSETDTEVIAHRVHHHLAAQKDLFKAVRATVAELEGAYALAVVSEAEPERIILAREGCPVVVGLGRRRKLRRLGRRRAAAGDAPLHVPRGRRRRRHPPHLDQGARQERRQRRAPGARERAFRRRRREGPVPPLHAQGNPRAAARRRRHAGRARGQRPVAGGRLRPGRHRSVQRTSSTCTSSPAAPAITPAWWRATSSSRSASCPARVEIASEYRYRNPVVPKNSLFVTISQSGETADTLAALRLAKQAGLSVVAGHLQRARELAGARIASW